MPARLSSLLVRDGLVGVKRMEKAFQRQVIYGGSLDTILLEMSLVPEDRLTQYLALASGLPPASRDEGDHVTADALALMNGEIAAQFRAIPLSIDGEALRILVCSPLQMSELEDLADLLDRPLQPLITPEYRWHLTFSRAYRIDPPARFTTLARTLAVETTPAPVGRAKSVIIDDHSGPAVRLEGSDEQTAPNLVSAPAPVAAADDTTERVELPLAAIGTLPERSRTTTIIGVQPLRPAVPEVVGIGIPPRLPAPPASRPQIPVPPADEATPVPVATVDAATPSTGVPRPLDQVRGAAGPRAAIQRAAIEPIATTGRDSPLAVVRARELLATADDRDTVFLTLLRAARARARYAGLLTVQGGAAIGRLALAEAGIDTTHITSVLVPLDAHSPFRTVVQNRKPHIGSLVSKDPSIDSMLLRLGGSLPASALLMPIILRDRVVAIVVAHRVHSDLKLVDVTELLPLAEGAADALGRLIVKHKSAGYRAPVTAAPAVEIADDTIDTKKLVRKDGGEWAAPPVAAPHIPIITDSAPAAVSSPAITPPPPPRRSVPELLAAIETATEGRGDADISEAIERATEILPDLIKRFPGKLRIDRFSVPGRPLRAAQYGGLLELTVKLGAAAAELLIEQLGSPQRDNRFYASVCAAELRPRNAVFALVERVFDQDFGVRTMAIEALAGYAPADLEDALPRARRALHASDPETVGAAAHVLVTLGDVDAIDDLMSELDRGDRGGEHVRRALASLTAQDFGLSERKWRKWYDGAKRRHRIEWLIDGLSHKVDGIREAAINDLRRLTGEYFGYHHDLPRKEREVAAERWASWWRETGQRRFVHREDERHRPTGVLPTRRE